MTLKVPAATVALIALLITAPVGAAVPKPSGAATAMNTILSVEIGPLTAKLGVDRADSSLSDTSFASAGLDVLASDTLAVSGAARDTRNGDPSGVSEIGAGTRDLSGLASATVTTGTVSTLLADDQAASSIAFDVASAEALDGFAEIASVHTTTGTAVGSEDASVTRSIEIGSLSIGNVRSLLGHLGVSPYDLGCGGVEAAGSVLGVPTGQACETLAGIQGDAEAARTALAAAEADMAADLATATSLSPLSVVGSGLVSLASEYGQNLSGSLGLLLGSSARQALIDEIDSRLEAVTEGIATASSDHCDTVLGALEGTAAELPGLDATIEPLAASLSDGCDQLETILEDLMDVSLVTLNGIDITLTAQARPEDPIAYAVGEIGEVRIGNVVTVDVPIEPGSEAIAAAAEAVRSGLADALDALGLGPFPLPSVEILTTTTSIGQNPDGTWYASASVTTLHIGLGSTTLDTDAPDDLGAIAPASIPAGGGRSGPARASSASSPELSVDLASFSGSTTFAPAALDTDDPAPSDPSDPDAPADPSDPEAPADPSDPGSQAPVVGKPVASKPLAGAKALPRTGVPAVALHLGGLVMLGGALLLRRFAAPA